MDWLLRRTLGLTLLLLLLASSCCHGTRNMEAFNSRWPELPRNPKFFFGFLPKAMPTPPSGPAKQHNSAGLQTSGRT
ncbi:hypothetical protein KFK09_001157 [Dendrobium nobile]|uniref:Uncharacterized protein n=1 Tax=Dendrobium nobile TaxID=94219 RepID=A0A8T3CA23_DENNO|nr:hypothetical protein KFK09_001157 [Dendrobium nobile]